MATQHNRLYLDIDGVLFQYDGENLSEVHQENGFSVSFLNEGTDHLLAGFSRNQNGDGMVLLFEENGNFTTSGRICVNRPRNAIELENGRIWYADVFRGIRFVDKPGDRCISVSYTHLTLPTICSV